MVIMTAKLSKRKRIIMVLILVLAIVVACVCIGKASGQSPQEPPKEEAAQPAAVRTNEDRVAFLNTFGWELAAEPVQTQQVRVPTDPSEVFLRYNELQKSQGFDLLALSGKTLNRYVYEVLNYPGADQAGTYYATILVYDNEVVGGDVCSNAKNGVMHGLKMPD